MLNNYHSSTYILAAVDNIQNAERAYFESEGNMFETLSLISELEKVVANFKCAVLTGKSTFSDEATAEVSPVATHETHNAARRFKI